MDDVRGLISEARVRTMSRPGAPMLALVVQLGPDRPALRERSEPGRLTVMPSSDEELARAIARGDEAGVRDALTDGADPGGADEAGAPFLQCALDVGHEVIVRALLEAGADPNLVTDLGEPILADPVRRQDEGAVRLLVEFGGRLEALDNERGSALHRVISFRDRPPLAAVLIDLNVPVNQADRHGWTPLHLAAAYGYLGSVGLLLDRGADMTARTLHGLTPADIAAQNGFSHVAEVLRSSPTRSDRVQG
jgi:cytohesin